uniref:Uncharacterized protein n=1 Tax=Solanum lycopersicum TaxID=4081 RepID=A0A3Q7HQU6_SOLLC
MDESDSPFTGIIRNCVTSADEEELRNRPFTVEFENFPESFTAQLPSWSRQNNSELSCCHFKLLTQLTKIPLVKMKDF